MKTTNNRFTGNAAGEVNVVALVKGEERYVFLYDDAQKGRLLRLLGRFAANPKLSFDWNDAAVVARKVTASD
jgi:hypothetical protein